MAAKISVRYQVESSFGAVKIVCISWDMPAIFSGDKTGGKCPEHTQILSVYAPIPTLQTIFHAFTQQNRVSSPQPREKTNNSSPINKIKLWPKRFLVMVNQVQLNKRSEKPRQRAGAFPSPKITASKSFAGRILAGSPMVARF
jgi:hypothetical protein